MDRTVADPLIGRLLDGRYRIGPRIARGGMATVYEAVDLRLDRPCAVKVMHAGLGDDDDFAARFVREARSAARLSHPNVVSVFDQGDDDGTLFLAMEYIPGHTLRDVIRAEAPMKPARALSLIEPVLSALGAAHAAGLIHRDVKPENVLIADDGRVKVADFGLARAVSAETQHTATGGVLIGTVSYLAPELVVDGRSDARSDVYAAGVLLYELLTGRKPHEGDSPIQVAYKHVHEDVPPPSAAVPGIPPYVDALVARATARDPQLRPADARVLMHQVRRVRDAIAHGVADDPELTADLTPTRTVASDAYDDIDYVNEDTPTILSTAQAAEVGTPDSREHDTSVIPATPRTPPGPAGPGAASPRGGATAVRPPAPRRSRRGPVLLLVVLLLAVGAGVGGWWFGAGRYTTVPGVIKMDAAQARAALDQKGLGYEAGPPAYSETVEKGLVLDTDPAGGERILDDGTVTVTLSLGPERYEVPVLRGLTEDKAGAALEKQHLSLGDTVRRFDEKVAEGVVLRSAPQAGSEQKPGTAVDLVVSRGPKPIEVPDFTGRDAARAEQRLSALGLEVSTNDAFSETVADGDVITQSPSSGTLYRGDAVTLTISKGPELVEVPDLRAVGIQAATERLEALGFTVKTAESAAYLGLGFVSSADPDFGTMAPKGSTITLYLV
ncbi:Stk1 family PASTA domain-containing Ser/Thr kinase [Nocardioides mesophilus]|uniref:non-specific serine/threonine protein kinase n=1 Tax=Nocardioides mesophilus TaxID=433659 RepID=A0A7G9RBZ4_9ACTN|nr:Stk1 family PASTA domain-containing Ser/Thr kinase [Nocardioides mesophilus]QNN53119.1 Stk1 family PASTA domain-containing Ser/Thr kinase [Nocardioides mesophilus]